MICSALKKGFNIDATPTGRNDLHVGDKKISGAAYKLQDHTALHHGTVLLNVDINGMSKYLNPNKKKLESKGIKSVVSRVLNLCDVVDITHEKLNEHLINAFLESHGIEPEHYLQEKGVITLNSDEIQNLPILKQRVEQLQDWDWRYGKTPQFSAVFQNRFDWGTVDFHIDSKQGNIRETQIFTDCLYPNLISQLDKVLVGKRYDPNDILAAFQDFSTQDSTERGIVNDLAQWLSKEVQ